jgi:hypothetical protein
MSDARVASSGADTAGVALRLLVVAGVALALALDVMVTRRQPARSGVQHVEDAVTFADAALLVRATEDPPDMRALDALAGMSIAAPLLAALPTVPRLTASLPRQLVTGRAAGLAFSLTGVPGARERVRLLDSRGAVLDSVDLELNTAGRGQGAFRVRPVREGWHEWRLQRGVETRTAAGWALPERSPRVLLAAGPPAAESRFAVRALEEAGAAVELRQPLGHGLTAGAVRVSLPVDAAQLAGFDVVIVLHGAVLDETRRAALQHYVMQYGGGVLIATRDPLLQRLGLAEGAQPDARSVGASSVIWSLPPELTPLPAGDEVSAAEPLVAAAAAFTAAADAQGSALLVLRSAGHGRAAALGLRESWHWRVAGGRIDEHREFWRSLVDWLAPRPPVPHVDVPYTIVETGLPVQVDVDAGTPLPPLRLRRPDGAAEPLPRSVGTADRAYYRFLPADTGLHAVLLPGDSVLAAVRALAAGSRAARTARAPMAGAAAADHAAAGAAASSAEAGALLALLADASGGRAMPGSELEAAVRTYSAAPPVPVQWRIPLLLLLLGTAVFDWSLRRLRGRS